MYTPIVATLGYVLSEDRRKTLLVHRNLRTDDPHYGKYNGLGGKMEAQESIHDCICREIKEEAGIICEEVVLRGTINWTGFGPDGEDWFGFISINFWSCPCGMGINIFCRWFSTLIQEFFMATCRMKITGR